MPAITLQIEPEILSRAIAPAGGVQFRITVLPVNAATQPHPAADAQEGLTFGGFITPDTDTPNRSAPDQHTQAPTMYLGELIRDLLEETAAKSAAESEPEPGLCPVAEHVGQLTEEIGSLLEIATAQQYEIESLKEQVKLLTGIYLAGGLPKATR